MYQVVEMYGDFEPWWFMDDWESDIVQTQSFETFEQALLCYEHSWKRLKATKQRYNSRANLMAAFWNEDDQRWCEECDESLPQYRSLALLVDKKEVDVAYFQNRFDQKNSDSRLPSSCSLKKSS